MKILRPLRDRDFALLWAGLTVSLIGDGIYLVAIAWQAYDISNTPSALALVGLAWSLGLTLFLLTGGVISDRLNRRHVMIAADLVRAIVLTIMGLLAISGSLEIWHMVVLVLFYASGEAFFGPAFSALVPDILEQDDVLQASALEQFVRQACRRLIGPAIGGLIVAAAGAGNAFLIDAGTFLFSATVIALMGAKGARTEREGSSTLRGDMVAGLRYARSHRWLWVTFLAAALTMLIFFGPVEVLLPYIIRNELDGSAAAFGLVLAADGAGSILASIFVAQRELPRRFLRVLYLSWGAVTLPLIGYALAESLWQLVILGAIFGMLITTGQIIFITLQNTRVPAEMRGRIHSLDLFTSLSLAPLSFALAAPAAEVLGVQTTLIIAGVLPALLWTGLYAGFRISREQRLLDATAPDLELTSTGMPAENGDGGQATAQGTPSPPTEQRSQPPAK